VEMRK